MFDVELGIDTDLLDGLQAAHQTFPEAVEHFAKHDLRPFASQVVDRTLRREPGPAVHPIAWESPKQRRHVMAKLRREGNLPYQRTHRYIRAWHVWGDYTRGLTSIRIFNDVTSGDAEQREYAEYVGGRRQQRFHRTTGWPNAADTLQVLSVELNERIDVGLPGVIDQALKGRAA